MLEILQLFLPGFPKNIHVHINEIIPLLLFLYYYLLLLYFALLYCMTSKEIKHGHGLKCNKNYFVTVTV